MLSISLGPLALPVAPFLLGGAIWASSTLASAIARRAGLGREAGNAVLAAVLLGLLAARLAHLALNADAYLASPLLALDVRDGGWHGATGAAVGAAWLAWRGWRVRALRLPVLAAALLGTALWLGGMRWVATGTARELPTLTLTDLASGAPATLQQAAQGRPVVLNLWASWCGPCQQEMPAFAAAAQREPGVAFVFVNQGEAAPAVRAFLSRQRLLLHQVLLDPASVLGSAVGSRGLPTTLFYDARGRLVDAHFGVLNEAALQGRLRALRAQP